MFGLKCVASKRCKRKDLNTYVDDICSWHMSFVRYKGLVLVPSYAAAQELMREGKELLDALDVLQNGKDAPRKRKKGTFEKWLSKRKKTYNAVIVKDYNEKMQEEVWVLVHFGKFSRRKK